MSSSEKKSHVPNPPKSIGLNRRLVIALIAILLSVMVLFLVFLKHYSPHQIVQRLTAVSGPIDQEDSSAQIKKIENEVHRPVLVDVNGTVHASLKENNFSHPTQLLNSDNEFRQASNASITVYHNPAAMVISPNASSSSLKEGNAYSNSVSGIKIRNFDRYKAQNMQSEKVAFLKQFSEKTANVIKSKLQKAISRYEINAGTIIPATLMTGINSTLPGTMIAKVRRDVFDSVSGNYLLIPQGTTLMGQYDSQIAYGQSRVLIVWSRLIFPNGTSFDLKGMPGADLTGMAGLHDEVDNHYFRTFSNALLFSLFGAVGQLSQTKNYSGHLSSQQILSAAIGQQMSQTAMQLIQKNMNIQPTIKIRQGTSFNVLLTRDMVLPHSYHFSV